jgi:iron complex outermembrane recepter protein
MSSVTPPGSVSVGDVGLIDAEGGEIGMKYGFQKRRGFRRSALFTTVALGISLAVPAFGQEAGAPAAARDPDPANESPPPNESAPSNESPPANESPPKNESAPADHSPAARGQGVEEIVVTAQRREQLLQDVPISMTVYDQKQLDSRNIVNASDLAAYTPSLTANRNFGDDSSSFAIRGFTQELRTTPSVGVYFGDVVSPRGGGSITAGDGAGPGAFFDLENVQVLKGPQGTLFGRNTTGGDVLIVPRKPTDEWEGYFESSAGNFNMLRFQGVANAPVWKDKLRVRLGFDQQTRDGYLHNTTGIGPSDLANVAYTSFRASIVANPLEAVENYSLFTYVDSNNHGGVNQLFACNSNGASTLPILLSNCEQQLAQPSGGFYDVTSDFPNPKSTIRQWQFINTTTWEVTDNFTVKNIVAPSNLNSTLNIALFGTNFQAQTPTGTIPLFFSTVGTVPKIPTTDQDSLVEEVRFLGHAFDKRLEWQGGLYYENSDPDGVSGSQSANYQSCDLSTLGTNPADFRCNNILNVFLANVSRSLGTVEYINKAVYGQGTFHLLPDVLSLTGGIRYSWDRTRGTSSQTAYTFDELPQGGYAAPTGAKCVASSATFPECTIGLSQSSQAPTGTFGLEWTPIVDSLLYAKWTRGYRQGSVNIFGVEGLNTFGPEHVDTYEIGAKRTFGVPFPGAFSVASFYNDFTDQQIQVGILPTSFVPTTAIVNAGKSQIWGVETEATVQPLDGVRLSGAYTYLNTKLESLDIPELPPTVLIAVPTAQAGDSLPYSPKNQLAFTASYRLPFVPESAGDVIPAATYVYTDNQQAVTASGSAFHTIPSYELLNLNLSWNQVMGKPVDASIFATNVLGEEYWTSIPGTFNSLGLETRTLGQPQMFGARIRYNFSL